MIEMNEELCQAVRDHPEGPVQLMDAKSRETYVLIRSDVFERLKAVSYEDGEFPIADSYPLLDDVLAKGGWNDPSMDIYNDFAAKEIP